MAITPVQPASVSIVPSENPVCSGTSVTFTANAASGGTYAWVINGNPVTTALKTNTYAYASVNNGDEINCSFVSSATCATGNPASSNTITMIIDSGATVSVSIQANKNTVCSGDSVTFSANPYNEGTYQWFLNGYSIGTDISTYEYLPGNGDKIYCKLTSDLKCLKHNLPAISDTITMTVNSSLVESITIDASKTSICSGDTITFTASPGKCRNGSNLPVGSESFK